MLYIDDHIDELDLNAALLDISEQRRQQALRFRHEEGRRLSVAVYLLLKRALQEQYGLAGNPLFSYEQGGKPRLAERPDLHFNLSHCRVAVACAVGEEPVGVDIETIRPLKPSLVQYTMNADEQALIARSERPEVAFTRLWTMKEALLKLTGAGISTRMQDVLATAECRFETRTDLAAGYVCTVCTRPAGADAR